MSYKWPKQMSWLGLCFTEIMDPSMEVHTFNPGTQEAEAGGFLSSRPAWSTN
jgi:major histocompatibility complex class I